MVVTLGQQYNVKGKPTVILYTYYINRRAETPSKTNYVEYIIIQKVNNNILSTIIVPSNHTIYNNRGL